MSGGDIPAAAYDDRDAESLALAWGVPAVHLYHSVGSSNDVARALAAGGAPAGTVVLADEQMAGRGRGGRAWVSPPGLGVWMSIVLRPKSLPNPGLLPILVGLAAAGALDRHVLPGPAIKWPNDLQLDGRKLGGILCEATWDAAGPAFVVVGIGINVLHFPLDFPAELRPTATSLRIASGGSAPPRPAVAGDLAAAILRHLAEPPAELGDSLLAELAARDALRGREVRVTGPEELTGTAEGISAAGALLVRTAEGVRAVTSGTVRPVAEPGPGALSR
ncbi:MAG TPA: biotin--[acetyl-CoA-carboxylase] ligase [Longimicrobium sp.]|nr:biotin--[acetyl-CoA-carboxylase] ligase [Longimicrobium sp.]